MSASTGRTSDLLEEPSRSPSALGSGSAKSRSLSITLSDCTLDNAEILLEVFSQVSQTSRISNDSQDFKMTPNDLKSCEEGHYKVKDREVKSQRKKSIKPNSILKLDANRDASLTSKTKRTSVDAKGNKKMSLTFSNSVQIDELVQTKTSNPNKKDRRNSVQVGKVIGVKKSLKGQTRKKSKQKGKKISNAKQRKNSGSNGISKNSSIMGESQQSENTETLSKSDTESNVTSMLEMEQTSNTKEDGELKEPTAMKEMENGNECTVSAGVEEKLFKTTDSENSQMDDTNTIEQDSLQVPTAIATEEFPPVFDDRDGNGKNEMGGENKWKITPKMFSEGAILKRENRLKQPPNSTLFNEEAILKTDSGVIVEHIGSEWEKLVQNTAYSAGSTVQLMRAAAIKKRMSSEASDLSTSGNSKDLNWKLSTIGQPITENQSVHGGAQQGNIFKFDKKHVLGVTSGRLPAIHSHKGHGLNSNTAVHRDGPAALHLFSVPESPLIALPPIDHQNIKAPSNTSKLPVAHSGSAYLMTPEGALERRPSFHRVKSRHGSVGNFPVKQPRLEPLQSRHASMGNLTLKTPNLEYIRRRSFERLKLLESHVQGHVIQGQGYFKEYRRQGSRHVSVPTEFGKGWRILRHLVIAGSFRKQLHRIRVSIIVSEQRSNESKVTFW